MPVRAIKKITSHKTVKQGALSIKIPDVILDAFKLDSDHELVCEVKRHFDKDKKQINEVNETYTFKSYTPMLVSGRVLVMAETPIAQKYGFTVGDYVEIVFLAVEGTKKSGLFSRKDDEVTRTD
ncbi:MAG: hypothetical protein QG588_848, partial [Candidatus Poribacteria bacterium]|nr:hypothetical protein [Candidatus Poribacteria bacterium]